MFGLSQASYEFLLLARHTCMRPWSADLWILAAGERKEEVASHHGRDIAWYSPEAMRGSGRTEAEAEAGAAEHK